MFKYSKGRIIGQTALTLLDNKLKRKALSEGILFPENFFGMIAGGNLNEDLFKNILLAIPNGTSEIMMHPGLNNEYLHSQFPWGYHWEEELEAALSTNNRDLIKQHRIKLINFGWLLNA